MKKIKERAEDEICLDLLQYLLIKVLKAPSTLPSGRRQSVGAELWDGEERTDGTCTHCLIRKVVRCGNTRATFPGVYVLLLEWGMFPMESDGWVIKSVQAWLQSDRWELAKSKELFSILKKLILPM